MKCCRLACVLLCKWRRHWQMAPATAQLVRADFVILPLSSTSSRQMAGLCCEVKVGT
jgi:hypothetical protein